MGVMACCPLLEMVARVAVWWRDGRKGQICRPPLLLDGMAGGGAAMADCWLARDGWVRLVGVMHAAG
ncbi:hypothetical protein ACLOJK_027296 [Asimina triloba]